tara:strand:- start:332 stop:649 length:318 start_codon:yes stop_codon:yes gene_type:complete
MNFKIKKVFILATLLTIYFPLATLSIEPKNFIQSTVDQASNILSDKISDDLKIEKLKTIAKESVDVEGIGFYTLGKYRKNLTEEQKKNIQIYLKNIFLKVFQVDL